MCLPRPCSGADLQKPGLCEACPGDDKSSPFFSASDVLAVPLPSVQAQTPEEPGLCGACPGDKSSRNLCAARHISRLFLCNQSTQVGIVLSAAEALSLLQVVRFLESCPLPCFLCNQTTQVGVVLLGAEAEVLDSLVILEASPSHSTIDSTGVCCSPRWRDSCLLCQHRKRLWWCCPCKLSCDHFCDSCDLAAVL